jgi:hypothetical protein
VSKSASEKISDLESETRGYLERIEEIVVEIEKLRDWVDGPQPKADDPDFDRSRLLGKAIKDTFDCLSSAAFDAFFVQESLEKVVHNLEDAAECWSEFETNTASR